jgi:predicted DNA-binding WGR domain protein
MLAPPRRTGHSADLPNDLTRLAAMAFLTRTDPAKNIDRFHLVDVTPTLFGEWAVLREWGRRGAPGTVRLDSYQQRVDAQRAERHIIKRRRQHGYEVR